MLNIMLKLQLKDGDMYFDTRHIYTADTSMPGIVCLFKLCIYMFVKKERISINS